MAILKRASKLDQDEYQAEINKGLGRAFDDAPTEDRQLSRLKVVIFSDLHRGARDGADDFQRCEPAYSAALGWYLERGYELWLLGDVEELWENDFDEVIPEYGGVLDLERQFIDGPGLRRFYGNHDLDWKDPALVHEHLHDKLPNLEIGEALRLRVLDGDEVLGLLFLAHGHQGTDSSDRFAWFSRWVVRNVWRRIQRSQGWSSTTPSTSYALRHKHDTAMFEWARERVLDGPPGERPILIAGHTHHPVFPGEPPPRPDTSDAAKLADELEIGRSKGQSPAELGRIRAELERIRALGRQEPYDPPNIDPPCYFNTGCCCFPDRDVTCLELNEGKIRLVRWLDDQGDAEPKNLTDAVSLRDLFERIAVA